MNPLPSTCNKAQRQLFQRARKEEGPLFFERNVYHILTHLNSTSLGKGRSKHWRGPRPLIRLRHLPPQSPALAWAWRFKNIQWQCQPFFLSQLKITSVKKEGGVVGGEGIKTNSTTGPPLLSFPPNEREIGGSKSPIAPRMVGRERQRLAGAWRGGEGQGHCR